MFDNVNLTFSDWKALLRVAINKRVLTDSLPEESLDYLLDLKLIDKNYVSMNSDGSYNLDGTVSTTITFKRYVVFLTRWITESVALPIAVSVITTLICTHISS